MFTKEVKVMRLENRINKLKNNPVENQGIINKANRQLKKLTSEKK